MARTRTTKGTSAAASASTTAASTTSKYTLNPESTNPPKLFILPKKATSDARVVTLQNPRYAKPTRYLVCPKSGICEFKRITAPSSTPQSWLIESSPGELEAQEDDSAEGRGFGAHVSNGADLYIATPVDPLFLILPALTAKSGNTKSSDPPKRMFLASDDHFDAISDSGHLFEALRLGGTRDLFESRMAAICDTVDSGDEPMFRLSETKLLGEIVSKAKRMSENGLPKSIEEKFVTKPLEAPIVGIVSRPSAESANPGASSSSEGDKTLQPDSQSSVSSTDSASTDASVVSAASTAATSASLDEPTSAAPDVVVSAISASPDVVKLQRLRVAFNFICSSYIAPETAELLKKEVERKNELVDFAPLDEYLTEVAKLRQEAAASRMSDYSQKRSRDEDEDERAEKRRKKEEDEKRKKTNESRGVRDLKKVNTTGMKKLSEFFKKK